MVLTLCYQPVRLQSGHWLTWFAATSGNKVNICPHRTFKQEHVRNLFIYRFSVWIFDIHWNMYSLQLTATWPMGIGRDALQPASFYLFCTISLCGSIFNVVINTVQFDSVCFRLFFLYWCVTVHDVGIPCTCYMLFLPTPLCSKHGTCLKFGVSCPHMSLMPVHIGHPSNMSWGLAVRAVAGVFSRVGGENMFSGS